MALSVNHDMNGQLQKAWLWMVAIYLFLGGVGSGAYAIAAMASLLGREWTQATIVGLSVSFPAVVVGSIFLLAHLGNPSRFFLAILRPHQSWISRGVWFITCFLILSAIHFAGYVWPFDFIRNAAGSSLPTTISLIGLLLAFMVMLYTGALLGASKGVPFWRTGVTPVLFMISALVTGLLAVMIGVLSFYPETVTVSQVRLLAIDGAGLILIELFILFFFLHSAYRLPESRDSSIRVMKSGKFIIGDLLIGLIIPLVLFLVVYLGEQAASVKSISGMMTTGAICGIIGGLLLRYMVLSVGEMATIHASGFQFRVVSRPKDPKAKIGALPPQ